MSRAAAGLARARRDQGGQAMVEFALVLPLILLLLFGILQVALVLNARQTVAYAARVAADTYARTLEPGASDAAASAAAFALRPALAPNARIEYQVVREREEQVCVRTRRSGFFRRSRRCVEYATVKRQEIGPATAREPGRVGEMVIARITYRYPAPVRPTIGGFTFPEAFPITMEAAARIETDRRGGSR